MRSVCIFITLVFWQFSASSQCLTAELTTLSPNPRNNAHYTSFSKETGKLYVTGSFQSNVFSFGSESIDSIHSEEGESTLYIMQLTKDGEMDWLKSASQSYALTYSSRTLPMVDGVVATFQFNDSVSFDNQYVSVTEEQALIVKYDLQGNVLWSNHFDSDGFSQAMGLAYDESGNIYVVGSFTEHLTLGSESITTNGNEPNLDAELFLAKISATGAPISLRYLGGGEGFDFATGMIYRQGKIFVSGFFYDNLIVGNSSLTSSSGNDAFLLCADTVGEAIWLNHLESNRVRITDMEFFGTGFLASGFFRESLQMGQMVTSSAGNGDGFLMHFGLNGNLLGMKLIGGEDGELIENLTLVDSGLIGFGGNSQSLEFSVDGFTFSNPDLNPPHINKNGFYGLCDTTLTVGCFEYFESTFESTTFLEHVSIDSILIIGSYFNDLPLTSITLMAEGVSTYVVRDCFGCDRLTTLPEFYTEDEFVLLQNDPNPFLDYTDIKYETSSCENCQIIITDMNGRVVKRIGLRNSNGKIRVYSSEIGTGLFSYSIIEEGRVIGSSKMISSRN